MAIKNYMINDKWLDIAKENIVEVKSTDGVIGSVKVNGQEYGGGGGSSDFSTAEVTIVNNTGATTDVGNIASPLFQISTDFLVVSLDTEIANNETLVLDLLTPINLGETPILSVITGVVTNMVNCSVDDNYLFITNPTQNSSCTITAS